MRITPELEAIIIRFALEGRWPVVSIAHKFGLSQTTVRRIVLRCRREFVEPRGDIDRAEPGR